MEGWRNTRPNPPVIQITAIRLWEFGITASHSPAKLQGLPTPELALEKEVVFKQVSRLDVELGLLGVCTPSLPLRSLPCPSGICQEFGVKMCAKK